MLTFRSARAMAAKQFESQGNCFSPDIHIIASPDDTTAVEWTQQVLNKYADKVIAYHITPAVLGLAFSIELQFDSTPEGRATARECRREYTRWFGKGGVVARRKKQANAEPRSGRKPRLFVNRMYRLADGQLLWYFGRWDRYGNLVGKVESSDRPRQGHVPLENKIVNRSELEKAELIPRGEEPWTL